MATKFTLLGGLICGTMLAYLAASLTFSVRKSRRLA